MAEVDLSGPRLADDLFFVVHDNVTGRMRLHSRLTRLGLAAAILGELMLAGRIVMRSEAGRIWFAAVNAVPADDVLTRTVLGHIVTEPAHPVRTWLQFLARTAHGDIGARMIAAGLLYPPTRLSRRRAPVDANVAAWPLDRVNLAIQRRRPLHTQDAVLLGLIVATGGGQLALWDRNPAYLSDSTAALSAPLQELIAQTEAAVGDSAISRW